MHTILATLYFGYLFFAVTTASTARFLVMRRYYITASTILGLLIAVTGIAYGSLHILALGVMTFAGKAILIPVLMDRLHGVGNTPRIAMRIRPSLTRLIAIVMVVVVSVMILNFPSHVYQGVDARYLVVAFSAISIALLALLNAKSTYSQLFGVLMMENGFSLLIFTLGLELHLFIELGLLMTALLVWYVMHILSAKLTTVFGEESVDSLNELSE